MPGYHVNAYAKTWPRHRLPDGGRSVNVILGQDVIPLIVPSGFIDAAELLGCQSLSDRSRPCSYDIDR